jgi:TRAP-type C4-dicarboxylate transport system substrate-binding protein
MMRTSIALAALAAGMTFAVIPASAQKVYKLKAGFVTINDSNHFVADFLKKELAKTTNGRIDVQVFPAAQLGRIPRQLEGLQLGTQEAFLVPPGFFVGIDQSFQVPDAPGAFDDISHQFRTMNHPPFREKFLNLPQKAGFVGKVIWSCGDTSIVTTKPFKKLSDLKGQKIRVLASKMESALVGTLGATGVPMPYSEVLPGMLRGTIDGVRSGIIVMYPSKFYTAAKHVTLTADGHIPCGVWMSNAFLRKLPGDLKQAIDDASAKVTPLAGRWGEEMTRQAERDWAKVGTVHRLSAADQAEMRRRVYPLGDKMLGGNPKTKVMYELMKEAIVATRLKK